MIKYDPQAMEKVLRSLPEEQWKRAAMFFDNLPKADVDTTLTDGDELPWCGGIRVIFTPGHTPGHICLYLRKSKILIAGDALMLLDGKLIPSPPEITADPAQAGEYLKKLSEFEIETVICYHGGVYRGGINGLLGG